MRTYSELITLPTFEERFKYLKLDGIPCHETFGFDRYMNQRFYNSKEWKTVRRDILVRDNGYDLGCEDTPIRGKIFIHHMNPIVVRDILEYTEYLMNPDYLISVSFDTHNAIHYGTEDILRAKQMTVRTPNDTCPWNLQAL